MINQAEDCAIGIHARPSGCGFGRLHYPAEASDYSTTREPDDG